LDRGGRAHPLAGLHLSKTAFKAGNHSCWVTRFDGGTIVEVRAYLDSALVAELFRQNPI
jgi:ketosteroid isomerase-like protein